MTKDDRYWWKALLLIVVGVVVFLLIARWAYPQGSPPASPHPRDSIGVDTDGNGTVDGYMYSTVDGIAHLKKGSNITLTLLGDTVTIAGVASAGTADSMGIDTDGNGTVDNYLYSTVAGAFHIKKGSNITLTVAGDTVTIASTGSGGALTEADTSNADGIVADSVVFEETNTIDLRSITGVADRDTLEFSVKPGVRIDTGASGVSVDTAGIMTTNVRPAINDTADILRAEMDDSVTLLNVFQHLDRDFFDTSTAVADPDDSIIIKTGGVTTTEILDATILEADLKGVNAPVDEDIFTYEATTGDFEWHTPAELGLITTRDSAGVVEETGGTDSTLWNVDQPWRLRAGNGLQITHGDSANIDTNNVSVVESELTLSNLGGAVTDAQVPNNITINTADTALILSDVAGGNKIVLWSSDSLIIGDTTVGAQDIHVVGHENLSLHIDSVIIGGDRIGEFAGTGLTVSSNNLTADLGTDIVTGEIVDGTILEADLNVTNSPTDNHVLTYNAAGTNFTWAPDAGGSSLWAQDGNETGTDSSFLADADDNDTIMIITDNDAGEVTWTIGADQSRLLVDQDTSIVKSIRSGLAGDTVRVRDTFKYDVMPYHGSVSSGTKFATIDDITGQVDIGVGDLKVAGSFLRTDVGMILDVNSIAARHAENFLDSIETRLKDTDSLWTLQSDSSYALHPWVGYDPEGWFGQVQNKWAMVHTTLGPATGSGVENPHLVVSKNGTHFHRGVGGRDTAAAGVDTVTNPLKITSGVTETVNFFSDATGVPGNDGDTLWIIWRGTKQPANDSSHLFCMGTSNGKDFTAYKTILSFPDENRLLSPTVISGDTYHMWTINSTTNPDSIWHWTTTHRPDTAWTAVDSFHFDIDDAGGTQTPWHFEIKKLGSIYYMLAAGTNGSTDNDLYWAYSLDGVNWETSGKIMQRYGAGDVIAHWDRSNLYRASWVWRQTGHGIMADLYYSANDTSSGSKWHTGKTTLTFDPLYDDDILYMSGFTIYGNKDTVDGIITTFPYYDGVNHWLFQDSSKAATSQGQVDLIGIMPDKFWVDTVYIVYQCSTATSSENAIDQWTLYGPKTGQSYADSIYHDRVFDFNSSTLDTTEQYIGEAWDKNEQIKLRISTDYSVADRWVRVREAWLSGWRVCCDWPTFTD